MNRLDYFGVPEIRAASQSSDRSRSCPRSTQAHHSNAKTVSWYTHASPIQLARRKTPLSLEGDLPLGEVNVLLVLLLGDSRSLLGSQSSSDGTGLLVSEVKGEVLGLLVELPEVLPLLLVDDSEDSGNGLAGANLLFWFHLITTLIMPSSDSNDYSTTKAISACLITMKDTIMVLATTKTQLFLKILLL